MRILLLSIFMVFGLLFLGAQNLKDDITNNDLEALKSKVALLEPDFKAFPYLAHYLSTTKAYQQAMLDYLIAQGADVNQVDDSGVGPLYYGITKSNLGAVQTLIASEVKVNAGWKLKNFDNGERLLYPSFFLSSSGQFTDNYQSFNSGGKRVAQSEALTLQPLWVAFQSASVAMVPELLAAGADPVGSLYNLKDDQSSTAKKAVNYSNTVLDQVVGTFATYSMAEDYGENRMTPTLFANGFRIWQAVLKLPKAKQPAIDAKLTANMFAYFTTGEMKAFKAELVKTGANTLAFLPYAALAENWDIVNLIFQYNSLEIDDAWDVSKQSLLAWCLINQHTNAAKLLLDHEAVVPPKISYYERNYGNSLQEAPLVTAARAGNAEMVKLLLDAKADPNTGFPLAFTQASPGCRDLLLKGGAEFNASWFYAVDRSYPELRAGLVAIAANEMNPDALKFWLSKGLPADPLALSVAVCRGSPECVKALLAAGADPGLQVEKGSHRYLSPLANFSGDYSKQVSLRDMAASLAKDAREPLVQNRYNNIVKQLDKAIAAK